MVEAEVWKDVVGYEGYYQVSNLGRVKSLSRKALVKGNYFRITKERILKRRIGKLGYDQAVLCINGSMNYYRVHRMVLDAFVGTNPSMEACHIDGCKSNNRLSNLKWGTKLENEADKLNHGTSPRGENNYNAILTEKQVLEIRASTESASKIASTYGVSRRTIRSIRQRVNWKHI